MGKNLTQQSNARLLLNAEPFGFGPTAAIASFFPYLRKKFSHIAYIGKGHTLDLQRSLPYDEIIDISGTMEDEIRSKFLSYDLFVTAMDFDMAKLAEISDISVVIYDALAWYWEKTSSAVENCDLYIVQNFFNVTEKTRNMSRTKIVPPIIAGLRNRDSKYILLNLGGLQNPLWPIEETVAYASLIINSVRKVVSDDQLLISTSKSVAQFLEGPVIQSFSKEEMLKILAQTRCAFMTPGLGNIYDTAQFGIPTAWLPPVNTSQGQQAILINQHQMADIFIDWRDIMGYQIGYEHKQNRQSEFLAKISKIIQNISQNQTLENKFEQLIRNAFDKIKDKPIGSTRKLLDKFGTGGAEKVADLIYKHANK